MTYKYKYILTLALLMIVGKAVAQDSSTGVVIEGSVFGGGKGKADTFKCEKGMVGVDGDGTDTSDGGTTVTISKGTVKGNVYGGGEVGRVEKNTVVKIGVEGEEQGETKTPAIYGNVFGAGAGRETHGYSALVRGNSTVTIQGNAWVKQNVYGGGEKATAGRYYVKGVSEDSPSTAPSDLPDEMPYKTKQGGACTVNVLDYAQIGPDGAASETAGHVFGAGKGVTPAYFYDYDDTDESTNKSNWSRRMVDYNSERHVNDDKGITWDYYPDDHNYVWEYFTTEDKYFEFLQTLALVTGTDVTINGSAKVKGSVYGGSESGYVQDDTDVKVKGGTIGTKDLGGAYFGNVYGGGKGDAEHMGTEKKYVAAGLVKGNTQVKIENGTILHNIYGGGAYGSIGTFTYADEDYHTANPTVQVGMPISCAENTGSTEITITGGTIGSNGHDNGMVFGSSRGDVAVPEGTPAIDPNDRLAWVYSTHVKIGDTSVQTNPTIMGSVYGSGENGHTFQNTIIDIKKGIVGITTGEPIGEYSGAAYPYRGNVYGGGCGTDTYWIDANDNGAVDEGEKHYNSLAGIVRGTTIVNITGGQVVHNVYGAGAMGSVGTASDATSGKTTINISGGRIGHDGNRNGNVFGAARGEYGISTDLSKNLANVRETEVNINYATTPAADNEGKTEQLIAGSVFGGGESGIVKESVVVKMTGGMILKDIYGGGALADTQTSNWNASANSGAGGWAAGKTSASATTTVRLTGGRIGEEVFGGGLGEEGKPAYVYGDVLVDLNGTTTMDSGKPTTDGTPVADDAKGCVVGQVFGCNNVNGTPKGDVMVHIYATQASGKDDVSTKSDKNTNTYDVQAVYGGGNLAAYIPDDAKNTTKSTKVIIDGCGLTSIETVYGGGNAASTPATEVTVNGTYEINELFGGGNGKDKITVNGQLKDNPGANVGFYDYSAKEATYPTKADRSTEEFMNQYTYGTGKASLNIYGGTIHRVFGGSNTKGNVRETAVTMLDENSGCDFCVDEAYGGGKSAPMDAEAQLHMACIPGLKAAYGGAEDADIQSNVVLNITNGTFERVFGGNNVSGTIRGSITMNIQEVSCRPLIIGELYVGGNQAGYSIYGYKQIYEGTDNPKLVWKPRISADDNTGAIAVATNGTPYASPTVNVNSFTSIGAIYGGGLGETATMVGNPTVNINVYEGKYYDNDSKDNNGKKTFKNSVIEDNARVVGSNVKYPSDNDASYATGYSVPSHAKGAIGAIGTVFGGGNAAPVIGNPTVNVGTNIGAEVYEVVGVEVGASVADYYILDNEEYKKATGTAAANTTYYQQKTVKGADIRGNIYGAGYGATAIVTGDTNVVIGKDGAPSTDSNSDSGD